MEPQKPPFKGKITPTMYLANPQEFLPHTALDLLELKNLVLADYWDNDIGRGYIGVGKDHFLVCFYDHTWYGNVIKEFKGYPVKYMFGCSKIRNF